MVWAHKARMHWVCNDIVGVTAEVYKVKDGWAWKVIDSKHKNTLAKNRTEHPLVAMNAAKGYMSAIELNAMERTLLK